MMWPSSVTTRVGRARAVRAAPVECVLVAHREVPDVGVQGQQVVALLNGLQVVREQQRIQRVGLAAQVVKVLATQEKHSLQREQFVALGDLHHRLLRILPRELRLRIIADRGPKDPAQLVFHLVLRLDRDRHRHHRVLGRAVEQREDMIAARPLGTEQPDFRDAPKRLDGDGLVRPIVEPPGAGSGVGYRHAEHQQLAEIAPERSGNNHTHYGFCRFGRRSR